MLSAASRPGRHRLAIGMWVAVATLLLWAALAPLHPGDRERAIDIGAGDGSELPSAVTLTLGARDVLLLRNAGRAAQRFGPVLLAPGQELRLPFEQTGVFPIAAGAWPDRSLTVTVVDWPAPGWERIKWRLAAFSDTVRYLPKAPRPG